MTVKHNPFENMFVVSCVLNPVFFYSNYILWEKIITICKHMSCTHYSCVIVVLFKKLNVSLRFCLFIVDVRAISFFGETDIFQGLIGKSFNLCWYVLKGTSFSSNGYMWFHFVVCYTGTNMTMRKMWHNTMYL